MKGLIYSKQSAMFGEREIIGYGDDDFYVEEINRSVANDIIIKNHYSGKIYNGTYINLGIFVNGGLHGVLQYGFAMNPASGGSVVSGTLKDEYLELNRMFLDDTLEKNSESKAISYSIKFIRNKHKKIKWIQSFADERCGGFGIVYQASNFKYFGEHTATFWEIDGIWYHNTLMTAKKGKQGKIGDWLQANKHLARGETLRQFRYIFFIKKNETKNCLFKEKTPPKHYEEDSKYDKKGIIKNEDFKPYIYLEKEEEIVKQGSLF
jgi:adenine modification enzyme